MLIFPGHLIHIVQTYLMCPDIADTPKLKNWGIAYGTDTYYELKAPAIVEVTQEILCGSYHAPPGEYIALLYSEVAFLPNVEGYKGQILDPPLFDFITLEVVAGD
jgi:hypothetical protein